MERRPEGPWQRSALSSDLSDGAILGGRCWRGLGCKEAQASRGRPSGGDGLKALACYLGEHGCLH